MRLSRQIVEGVRDGLRGSAFPEDFNEAVRVIGKQDCRQSRPASLY